MKRLLLSIVAVTALGAAAAQPAAGAPAPRVLGQNPTSEGPLGGCQCTVVQLGSGSGSDYLAPFNGVLTRTKVWVGATTESEDWVQARTFRTSGPADAKVISEGEKHSLTGLSTGATPFDDRIPMAAGDVLGARFHDSALVTETPFRFSSGAGDLVGTGPFSAEVGGSFTASTTPNWRANIVATLEADEDHDGYGDSSQDLCPGSPIATTACSGTLFGSPLAGLHTLFTNCGHPCLNIQKSIGGHSTAAPQNGVVVRWRLFGAATGTYRVRVVAPNGSGGYTILHSSDPGSVTSEPEMTEQISTFATRLPIPAGGYVALAAPLGAKIGARNSGTSAALEDIDDHVVDGTTAPATGETSMELLYDADIEPDADRDGYGDITQDACSTDATTRGMCGPPAPTNSTTHKPAITGFKASPKSFRVKQGGAIVSRHRVHAGTALKLTLTEGATVSFAVKSRAACKAAKGKPCPKPVHPAPFKRKLGAGRSSVAYSGRVKQGRKAVALPPGAYQVTAVATNADGKSSAPARTEFVVVP